MPLPTVLLAKCAGLCPVCKLGWFTTSVVSPMLQHHLVILVLAGTACSQWCRYNCWHCVSGCECSYLGVFGAADAEKWFHISTMGRAEKKVTDWFLQTHFSGMWLIDIQKCQMLATSWYSWSPESSSRGRKQLRNSKQQPIFMPLWQSLFK